MGREMYMDPKVQKKRIFRKGNGNGREREIELE